MSSVPHISPLIQYRTVGKQASLAFQAGATVWICVSTVETLPVKLVLCMGDLGRLKSTEEVKVVSSAYFVHSSDRPKETKII